GSQTVQSRSDSSCRSKTYGTGAYTGWCRKSIRRQRRAPERRLVDFLNCNQIPRWQSLAGVGRRPQLERGAEATCTGEVTVSFNSFSLALFQSGDQRLVAPGVPELQRLPHLGVLGHLWLLQHVDAVVQGQASCQPPTEGVAPIDR